MPAAIAHVATPKPSAYLKQLCRHFGHRNEVAFDDAHGEIHLPSGVCRLDATGESELTLTATAAEPDSLDALTRVIGSHLERFGSRDGLTVAWTAS
jgi:hypothetical protein